MIIETAVATRLGFAPVPALLIGVAASIAVYYGWKRYKARQVQQANAAWSQRMTGGQTHRAGFFVPPGD